MVILRRFIRVYITILGLLVFSSCEPQIQNEIPFVFVEIDINLNNVEFVDLQKDGGFVYILGGVRGIILYRKNLTTYKAFERNSPVNSSSVCAVLDVDESDLFIIDPCSQALFDFDGTPINGISPFPLRQYITILDNNWLYIRSE